MPYNKYFLQKCLFASTITIINAFSISLAYTFSTYWYLVQTPLLLVLFFNISTVFLALFCSMVKRNKRVPFEAIPPTTIGYFIPCYNESSTEIRNTLDSFFGQTSIEKHRQFYLTVCDGRKQGSGNILSTDRILKQQIFPNSESVFIKSAYCNSEGAMVDVEVLYGTCPNQKPFFVIIKERNSGKRDSIGIARRLFFSFNTQQCCAFVNPSLLSMFTNFMKSNGVFNVQFIVGVDADTIFEPDCTVELLSEICRKPSIMATSGMVKVEFAENQTFKNRLWEGYQHVEYLAGQGLMRNQQNLTQQKINCLPGCLNITRICEETCGERLLSQYMVPPRDGNHIFQQIRATASEDRHSVMLLLKLNKKAHTTVNWNAQARTSVPIKLSVFLSQRRRWSLGSATHGSWMIIMANIPMWERFSSLIFVLTYLINPFLMYSAVTWIMTMVSGRGDSTYYLFTGIVQIVTVYKLLIPVWCPLSCKERVIYYLFYFVYVLVGPFLGIMVLCYSMYNMDDFGWGKTRKVKEDKETPTLEMLSPVLTNITNLNNTAGLDSTTPFPIYKLHASSIIGNQKTVREHPMSNMSSSQLCTIYNPKVKSRPLRPY